MKVMSKKLELVSIHELFDKLERLTESGTRRTSLGHDFNISWSGTTTAPVAFCANTWIGNWFFSFRVENNQTSDQ